MFATTRPYGGTGHDALPVCLSRENPHRLVSLWDIVKAFDAALFVHLAEILGGLTGPSSGETKRELENRTPVDEPLKEAGSRALVHVEANCIDLGLVSSLATVRRIQAFLTTEGCKMEEYRSLGSELQGRLVDEFEGRFFLSLNTDEAEYYLCPFKGWENIIARFPDAQSDIEEMSKCFALSRYAAAVFHSVNVIECGLLDLGKFLIIADPKSGWTAVSNKLDTLVSKTKFPDLDPAFQATFPFLEQVHGTVAALKNAWRNKISHAQGKLTVMTADFRPEVAEEIMKATRAFMRRLATEMP